MNKRNVKDFLDRQYRLKRLALASILIAIPLICSIYLNVYIVVFKFSVANAVLHIAGYILGPIYGFAIAIITNTLAFFINSNGAAFHWGFTITAGLQGLIAGLMMLLNKKKVDWKVILATNVITTILCSIILRSYFLAELLGKSIYVLMKPRILNSAIMGILYIIIEILLITALKPIENKLPSESKFITFSFGKKDKSK